MLDGRLGQGTRAGRGGRGEGEIEIRSERASERRREQGRDGGRTERASEREEKERESDRVRERESRCSQWSPSYGSWGRRTRS